MWYACGDYSVEGFLQGKGRRARELFERFESLIARAQLEDPKGGLQESYRQMGMQERLANR